MLLWFKDLMNVTEEVTIHRPNVSTLLSSAFIRGDLNAATRGPFIRSLISCLFSDEVYHLYFNHLCKENYVLPSSLRFRLPLRSAKGYKLRVRSGPVFFSEVTNRWISQFHTVFACVILPFTQWTLLWSTTPKLPGSRSSAVRKNNRHLPNRKRNTAENSVICSVRGLLFIQAYLWKINGSWTFPPSSYPR